MQVADLERSMQGGGLSCALVPAEGCECMQQRGEGVPLHGCGAEHAPRGCPAGCAAAAADLATSCADTCRISYVWYARKSLQAEGFAVSNSQQV